MISQSESQTSNGCRTTTAGSKWEIPKWYAAQTLNEIGLQRMGMALIKETMRVMEFPGKGASGARASSAAAVFFWGSGLEYTVKWCGMRMMSEERIRDAYLEWKERNPHRRSSQVPQW